MTAPRMPRHQPMWRDTTAGVRLAASRAELEADLAATHAPAAQIHQACPPCNGNCIQGRHCPADQPQGSGEWTMVAIIVLVVVLPVLWQLTRGGS